MAILIDSAVRDLPLRIGRELADEIARRRGGPIADAVLPLNAALLHRAQQIRSLEGQLRDMTADRDKWKADAKTWRDDVEAMVDIYFDGTTSPPEQRAYVDNAFPTHMENLRAALAKGANHG